MNDVISISIIVPVYNVEDYLSDCLDSILKQKFENYEIICINDGSSDGSEKILQKYSAEFNKIKIITHASNKGLSAARNSGLKNAQGKYVMFVDSDDMIVENMLVELYQEAEKNQAEIVYFDITQMNEDGIFMPSTMKKVEAGTYSGKELFCLFVNNRQMKFEACRQLISSDFLKRTNILFYEGIFHEDELFSFVCAMSAEKVVNLNKEYYIYRQRKGSIMSLKNFKRAHSLFVVLVQMQAFWISHTFKEMEQQAIEKHFRNLYSTYQYYCCFGEDEEELGVGGIVEKTLYDLLHKKTHNKYLELTEEQLLQIEKAKNVIVFGAGRAAVDIVNTLQKRGVKIDVIAVSNRDFNPEKFCGISVDSIDNIIHYMRDALVIVGVTGRKNGNIYDKLQQLGYSDIIIAEDIV